MELVSRLADEELVRRYKEGDNEAFDALLAKNQDRLFQYICFMTGGNADVADDVFQETWMKAIMAIRDGRYEENGQFGAWLLRIARNIVLDDARGKRSHRIVRGESVVGKDGELMPDTLECLAGSETDGETQMVKEQEKADVRNMLAMLPDVQREVVVLRMYEEMSFKEIASLTGVSINTALGRMRYAMINLRRMVRQE